MLRNRPSNGSLLNAQRVAMKAIEEFPRHVPFVIMSCDYLLQLLLL